MKILPPSQIKNLSILEQVLEELRLNVIDHIRSIGEALDLYSLTTQDLKNKLNLLGLTNINIGKFIKLDLNSSEFEFISPEFYKMYRKLNQHRGNKMSMDYVFHSAGMMNTLVHSNTQFYNQDDIFGDTASFFDFETFRDNQFPELGIGDGYIIVPYTSNKLQTLKHYLATNPIIFTFLPAGYTFIFLSDYRNGFSTGILQYDNLLNYNDDNDTEFYIIDPDTHVVETHYFIDPVTHEIIDVPYIKPLYWESMVQYKNNEILDEEVLDTYRPTTPEGREYKKDIEDYGYQYTLYYYEPTVWRDRGKPQFTMEYPRFTSDDLYPIPLIIDGIQYTNLDEYLAVHYLALEEEVLEKWREGFESDLNNTLFYKDVWLGDYLLSALKGSNRYPEYYDHVMGMKSIQAPTYSYASLYNRGESLASQYFQREEKIISTSDTLIQENKKAIISDRREIDGFKFQFVDEYSLWLLESANNTYTAGILENILGFSQSLINLILQNVPCILLDALDLSQAEAFYYQLIDGLIYRTIFAVKDIEGNIVLCNDG